METENAIYFYNLHNKFSFMSNFYEISFTDNENITYNCSEQYFMYQKCKTFNNDDKRLLNNILITTSPGRIKALGRSIKNYDETIWNSIRYEVMLKGLHYKFSQNEDIKMQLLNTDKKILYEASPYDNIWGIGYNAKYAIITNPEKYGKNLLGNALMELRWCLSYDNYLFIPNI